MGKIRWKKANLGWKMTILEKKNVFFMINGSKYIIYVKIARGDRIPLRRQRILRETFEDIYSK